MKKLTRWRPDTCACVVDLEWDSADEVPALVCVALEPCPLHASGKTLQEQFEDVRAHNSDGA